MKIYIAHSREFDFKNELYIPIRNNTKEDSIILPHESNEKSVFNRDSYKKIDLVIAECSYPSTGMGIELGWFSDDNIPIYCIYKKGKNVSGSIKAVTQNIYEYETIEDMIKKIKNIIKDYEGEL